MNTALKRMNVGFPRLLADWFDPFTSFDASLLTPESKLGFTLPTVNVKETGKDYLVELAAPGLERKDFKVEIDNNLLSISVDKEEEKKETFFRSEMGYGTLLRTVLLPVDVDTKKAKAELKDGILEILLPKIEVQKSHKIKVA